MSTTNEVLQVWSVAGPLVGVIAGGILAGAFGLIAERRSHMNARSREVAQLRRVEYFSAIDSVHRLRRALEQFRAALSGRWQPDDDDRSAEAEQMRERDKAGAVSFNRLDAAIDELRNTTLKVRAVGSERVSSAMDALDRTVGAYFMEAFAEIPTFKADRFRVFFDSYTEQSTALVGLMRRDLEIDRIYIPRQTDEPEPKKLR